MSETPKSCDILGEERPGEMGTFIRALLNGARDGRKGTEASELGIVDGLMEDGVKVGGRTEYVM